MIFKYQNKLKDAASEFGFSAFGIAGIPANWDNEGYLRAFVDAGWHGDMVWMKDTFARRSHPRNLWPQAKSAVVVGTSYAPPSNPITQLENKENGVVSVYATRADYHDVVKGRLKQFAAQVVKLTKAQVKVFVDTAPLMEKPLAALSGIGWQGKNTMLVSRDHGCWLFLGVVLCDVNLGGDSPEVDHCGSCTRCLDVCPTNAFPEPYKLDATKCLAYYSVEHQGQIPYKFRKPMGNRVFGCDDCLAVCPWNKFAQTCHDDKLVFQDELHTAPLSVLSSLNDAEFRQMFRKTPVKRLGRDRFIRNVLVAMGNAQDADLLPVIQHHLMDENPLVRGMAIWAISQYTDTGEIQRLHGDYGHAETDPDVLKEWQYATGGKQ